MNDFLILSLVFVNGKLQCWRPGPLASTRLESSSSSLPYLAPPPLSPSAVIPSTPISMSAYGDLSSLVLTLDDILDNNDAAISLDRGLLGSLRARADFLLLSLKNLPIHRRRTLEMKILESRISDVAFSASSYISEVMLRDSETSSPMFFDHVASLTIFLCIFSMALYLRNYTFMTLVCFIWMNWRQKFILLVRALGNVLVRNNTRVTQDDLLSTMCTHIASLMEEVGKIGEHIVVGMESDLETIMEKLIFGPKNLQIVSMVGMAGIGKTCLATRVWQNSFVLDHFDVCAWATISQSRRRASPVLLELIKSSKLLRKDFKQRGSSDETALGEYLYKRLYGRRYLIVMDDMWDMDIWDVVRRHLPDEGNGSRVLLTTQMYGVAHSAGCPSPHRIPFLKEHESRSLLQHRVFGGEDCPEELKEIQDVIVNKCAGLPLALVLISGHLSKIERTEEIWASFVGSLEFDAREDVYDICRKIATLSYKHLPPYLRPCFLYMGMFPKDYMVPVAKLAQLWAAEGFLQPDSFESPEVLAEERLQDLVQRNLILVSSWSSQGKIKNCRMHDVLRELFLQKARQQRFFLVINNLGDVREADTQYHLRLSIHKTDPNAVLSAIELGNSRAHTLMYIRTNLDYPEDNPVPQCNYFHYRRIRVLDLLTIHFVVFPSQIPNLVGLRYLALTFMGPFHPYISRLQNLETIVHRDTSSDMNSLLPVEIWMMLNLRHLHVPGTGLPSPPDGSHVCALQTMLEVINLSFGIQILDKIKSLKKLGVCYDVEGRSFRGWSRHELKNLAQLNQLVKLKFLVINSSTLSSPPEFAFPPSLRKLTLSGCRIPWGHLTSSAGELPNLEVLKLRKNACIGEEWESMEGKFKKLIALQLEHIDDLVHWRTEDTHFPCLQCLTINSCDRLDRIPSEIGDIMSLKRIEVINCHSHIVVSAQTIQEEIEQYTGSSDLQVLVS